MANYGPATSDIWLDSFTNELHYGFLTIDELDNVYQRPANARGQMATTSGYTYTYGAVTIYGGYEYQLPNSPYVYVIGRIQNNINNYTVLSASNVTSDNVNNLTDNDNNRVINDSSKLKPSTFVEAYGHVPII